MLGMVTDPEYRDALPDGLAKGRGAGLNPGNRFETVRLHVSGEHLDEIATDEDAPRQVGTEIIPDHTRKVINRVDSPDIGFNWTVNPYRGCEHGCIYCYARPYHELIGFSSGLDFETKIVAKYDAPQLLRKELASPRWKAESIVMSGVTDCYQPIEAKLKITRGCLEVFAQSRQPVGIVTKNRLVLRDLDLLRELAWHNAVRVAISVTTLDNTLAAKMEPRASSPTERLDTINKLRNAAIPVMAMVAPVIPGLNDKEIPRILAAVAEAGAVSAAYVLLRLPYQVKDLFIDWLRRQFPDRAKHVENLLRDTREGELYDSAFGTRMKGKGQIAQQIGNMFRVFSKRYKLAGRKSGMKPLSNSAFRPPMIEVHQMPLFPQE